MKLPNNKSYGREEYFASRISRMVALMHGEDENAKGFFELKTYRKTGTKTIITYSGAGVYTITIRKRGENND